MPGKVRDLKKPALRCDRRSELAREAQRFAVLAASMLRPREKRLTSLDASIPARWRSLLAASSERSLRAALRSSPVLEVPSSVRELLSLRPTEFRATGSFLLGTSRVALLILVSQSSRHLAASEFFDLLAEALIATAKGFRLARQLDLARQALEAALRASRLGSRCRGTRVRALRLLARVLSGERKNERAHRLLARLARLHTRGGEDEAFAIALRAMANNFMIWGYPKLALSCLARAVPLLGEKGTSREQFLAAATSFAWLALDLDFLEDAQECYSQLERLRTSDLPEPHLFRLEWLGARILRRRGLLQSAETGLRSVCEGYARAGMDLAFLRVSFELLQVLADRRRFDQVSAVCARLLEVVGAERMPIQVRILADQGSGGDLTPALLRELLRSLSRSRWVSG